jgi:hypothetical protein
MIASMEMADVSPISQLGIRWSLLQISDKIERESTCLNAQKLV